MVYRRKSNKLVVNQLSILLLDCSDNKQISKSDVIILDHFLSYNSYRTHTDNSTLRKYIYIFFLSQIKLLN